MKIKLTPEEKELRESVARGEWKNRPSSETKDLVNAAKSFVKSKKESRVNLRMSEGTLLLIKKVADRDGIPYQTMINSILHRYATGELVDRKVIDELKDALKKAS